MDSIAFSLGEPIDPQTLKGYDALVHCAYDFSLKTWDAIHARNVEGSKLLLRAAHTAGVKSIVYFSTMSAYDGCRSLYGKGKLEVEQAARELGAWILRPGLVYGEQPGAMFGQLVANVRASSLLPMPGNGAQPMWLIHEHDLTSAVEACLREGAASPGPITVAHEQMWPFQEILHEIGRKLGKKVTLAPIPWQAIWLGLKSAEAIKLPINMRSDSLVSLVYQNPTPDLNLRATLGVEPRAFGDALDIKAG